MPAWAWALVVIGAAAAAGLLLLSIPVDVRVRFARPGSDAGALRVAWLWGAVSRAVPLGRSETPQPQRHRPAGRPKAPQEKRVRSPQRPGSGRRSRLPSLGFLARCLGLGLQLIKAVEVRRLRIRVAFGSALAEETGALCAVAYPVVGVLRGIVRKAEISIEPDFSAERFEYEVDGWVRLTPLRVLAPVLRFMLRPSNMSEISYPAGART